MILPWSQYPSTATWPDDFVSFDQSRMLVHPDWVDRLALFDWTTVDAVMRAQQPKVFRRADERENATVDFGPHSPACYLKRHFTRKVGPWAKEWYQTGLVGPAGWMEADSANACQQAGVATPKVVAAGWKWMGRPWRVDSFFLCESVEDAHPADRLCQTRPNWTIEERHSLIEALADAGRRLHRAGLFHRDFYWCHLFVREPRPGQFDVTLIDLQRIFRPRRFASRWRLKDLAQFVFSAPRGWLAEGGLERWFAWYLGRERLTGMDRAVLRAIEAKAALYRWREGSQ